MFVVAQGITEICADKNNENKLRDICNRIETFTGISGFNSWQICADMLESGVLSSCSENDFARIWIGSKVGVGMLLKGTSKEIKPHLSEEFMVSFCKVSECALLTIERVQNYHHIISKKKKNLPCRVPLRYFSFCCDLCCVMWYDAHGRTCALFSPFFTKSWG